MSVEPHPLFISPPNPEAAIWRYTDLAKLLSLLDRSALFFPRLDKLDDPFEGYYTKTMLALEKLNFEQLPPELKARIPDNERFQIIIQNQGQMRNLAKMQREVTFVNSWYCHEYESAAMWSQYLNTQEGIAIRSSYQRLYRSLNDYHDFEIHIGMVKYLDYESETIPVGNILAPVMCKRRSFEHERELRAVIWTLENAKNSLEENKFKESSGLYVQVDIAALIDRIYLAPTAPGWVRELIESLLKRFGYASIPVIQSSLSEAAFY